MSNTRQVKLKPDPPMLYQIRIKGHLDGVRTEWFEGLTIALKENGDTLLTGSVIDQAALHGLLRKVRDLGMPLLSVNRVGIEQTDVPEYKPSRFTESPP